MQSHRYTIFMLFAIAGQTAVANEGASTEYTLPTIVINYGADQKINDTGKLQNQANNTPVSISLFPEYSNQRIDNTISQNAWINSSVSSAANPSFYLKGQRASVLLNDIPLNQFNSQAQNISLIPQNSIDRIEINPSANSVLYGGMGLGGTIDIKQKFLDKDQYGIDTSAAYPLGGGINVFINQLLNEQKTWSLQLANNAQSLDGYRDYSRSNSDNVYIALMHQSTSQKFTLNFSDSYQYLHFPGALNQEQNDEDPWQATKSKEKYINHTVNSQLSFEQHINAAWLLKLNSQYQQQWANIFFPGFGTSSKQGSSLFYLRPSVIFNNCWFKNTSGMELNYQTFNQSNTINQADQTNVALFNQSDLNLNNYWQTGVGERFEHSYTTGNFSNNTSGSQIITIGAGDLYLQYNWSKNFNARTSVSYTYQLPFIDQSNLTPGTSASFGLNPQTAWVFQLDNSYKSDLLTLKNSTYWMLINNQIDYDPSYQNTVPSSFPGANINLPPTQTIGNLFSVDYIWNEVLNSGTSFALNLNTFRSGYFNNTNIANNQVPGQPPLNAEVHTHWQLDKRLSLWLQEEYFSASYAYGDYTNTLPKQSSYFLTNLGAKYQLEHWQLNFAIYNLFNKFYYNYVSTYDLQNLSYYPANGITAMLNVQYQFS